MQMPGLAAAPLPPPIAEAMGYGYGDRFAARIVARLGGWALAGVPWGAKAG